MNNKPPAGYVVPLRYYRPRCEKKGHKLRPVLTSYLEYAICCKRHRCQYLEINPHGFIKELLDRV